MFIHPKFVYKQKKFPNFQSFFSKNTPKYNNYQYFYKNNSRTSDKVRKLQKFWTYFGLTSDHP